MMSLRQQAEVIKMRIIKMLGGECCICGCKISRKGMTVHHLWYIFNDVVYSNYPRNDSGKLAYYTALEPLVKENPKRFKPICNTDHQSLERLCRFGDEKLNKLLAIRKITKTRRDK